MVKEHFKFIDIAKAIAIFAVILDHNLGIIYASKNFQLHTVYSVTLFIFLAGITASISMSNQTKLDKKYIIKRESSILIPYTFATLFSTIYMSGWRLDVSIFFNKLLTFSALPPLYFVAFYIQLVLISTILYKIIKKCEKNLLYEAMVLVLIYPISWLLTYRTFIPNLYGGGGSILGGSYLFVYVLGMIFQRHMGDLKKRFINIIGIAIGIFGIVFLEVTHLITRIFANPPNKFTIIYALSIFLLIFGVSNLFKIKNKILLKIIDVIAFIGKNSLYIFLYHWVFLGIGRKYLQIFKIQNSYLMAIWIVSFCLIPPIIIAVIAQNVKNPIKKLTSENDINITLNLR